MNVVVARGRRCFADDDAKQRRYQPDAPVLKLRLSDRGMGFQPVRARNYRLSRLFGLASLAKRETILDQTAERPARFYYRREACLITKCAGRLPV